MPAATATQKEVVRLLSIEHGHKRAAELTGVPYDVVRQWSVRGKWKSSQSVTQRPIAVATANVQSEIEKLEHKTRTSLARSAAHMAEKAETATLRNSGHVHNVAKTAAIVHRWDTKEQGQANVIVNVALLGIQPADVSSTTLNVESECQDSGA